MSEPVKTDPERWETLPEVLRSQYRYFSCLSAAAGEGIFLARENSAGLQVLIKVTNRPEVMARLRNEYELLRRIEDSSNVQARAFPKAIELVEVPGEPGFLAMIRAFIPGHSLESLVESRQDRPGLDREAAVRYLTEVLDQLDFLHHLDPPIIHRDIKPQNVIVDEEDHCHLIDLDIARTPSGGTDSDTTILGTRLTAPPEQFGYRPTDVRSDVYSAGVLLRYCVTGGYEPDAAQELDPLLRHVTERATSFDPADRYPSAAAMRRQLSRTEGKGLVRLRLWFILLAVLLLGLGGCFLLRGSGGKTIAPVKITQASFHEDTALYSAYTRGDYSECTIAITPEEMRAVRYVSYVDQLAGRIQPERTKISENQLAAYMEGLIQSDLWPSLGNLLFVDLEFETLEPLRRGMAARNVCVEFHNCTLPADLSPLSALAGSLYEFAGYEGTLFSCDTLSWLAGADHLDVLSLSFVPGTETDLSILSELSSLRILRLVDVPVDEAALEAISKYPRLEVLQLNGNGITDAFALERISTLQDLDLRNNPVEYVSR